MGEHKWTYEEIVWHKAVGEAESDVMRVLPTLTGGRRATETVEQYAERCFALAQERLIDLRTAREQLKKIRKGKP